MTAITAKSRRSFTWSNKKLRRARRLYALFIRNACEFDELGTMHEYCARRAKEAGLYAPTTFVRDIAWSFKRKHWKMHPEFCGYWRGWFEYLSWLGGKPITEGDRKLG